MLKLLKYIKKREWFYVLCALLFIILKVYLALKMPDYMSNITKISQGDINPETGLTYEVGDIWFNGLMMFICAFGATICAFIGVVFTARIASNFSARLRELVYTKVQHFSSREIKNFTTSSLITRTTNDINQVQTLIVIGFDIIFKTPITIIWSLVKATNMRWEWTLATIIAVIVMIIGLSIIIYLVKRKFKKLQKLTDNLNQVTRENISGIRVVRAYNAEKYQEKKFDEINDDFTKTNLYTSRTLALLNPFTTFVTNGVLLAIYWIGAYVISESVAADYLNLYADMVAFISYGIVIVSAFTILTVMFMVAPRALVSAKRINDVLECNELIKDGSGVNENKEVGTVEFKDVYFKYPDGNKNILSGISFKVKKGDSVAFIGSTGCGKSSVVSLVSRFYDATSGEVLVDGVNVKDYKKNQLCRKIAFVAQKPVMFSGNIRGNINFGDNNADENMIKKSLDISQSTDFVVNKKGGLDGSVSQNGTNFSGGQKQRLSIARGIARDTEIYIFDDAFSALDYKTEKLLRSGIKKEMKGITSLIVAQRISTIMDVDQIIVLDNGKIVGQGTHKELMKNCPLYQNIAYSQLSKEELA